MGSGQRSRNFHAASFVQRSPRRVDQATWPARAPEQSFEPQPSQLRLQAGNVSATPSVEIAAALASTMAQRSLKVVTAVSPSLRAKAGCEAQARATAPVSRSEALGSSQCSCNFHAANASATQLAPAAALDQRWRLNRCSLHLNYPPPLVRGEVVAASRRLLAGLRKPQAAASQAPASPYEAARIGQATWPALRLFALKPSQNKDANFKRLHCGLVVYARSSASLITPCRGPN